jgi:hypothetical protein
VVTKFLTILKYFFYWTLEAWGRSIWFRVRGSSFCTHSTSQSYHAVLSALFADIKFACMLLSSGLVHGCDRRNNAWKWWTTAWTCCCKKYLREHITKPHRVACHWPYVWAHRSASSFINAISHTYLCCIYTEVWKYSVHCSMIYMQSRCKWESTPRLNCRTLNS